MPTDNKSNTYQWTGKVARLDPVRISQYADDSLVVNTEKWQKSRGFWIFVIIFYAFLILILPSYLETATIVLIHIFMPPVIIAVGAYIHSPRNTLKIRNHNKEILREFAVKNNLEYNYEDGFLKSLFASYDEGDEEKYDEIDTIKSKLKSDGSLFKYTERRRSRHHIYGNFGGLPFVIFEYAYSHKLLRPSMAGKAETEEISSSGKNYFTNVVLGIKLPRNMPHLVVDSLVESRGKKNHQHYQLHSIIHKECSSGVIFTKYLIYIPQMLTL